MVILTPKMVENIFEILCILTAVKNYTSNFTDTPFRHDYIKSSKASLNAPSNQPYFLNISTFWYIFHNFYSIFSLIFCKLKLINYEKLWLWKKQSILK